VIEAVLSDLRGDGRGQVSLEAIFGTSGNSVKDIESGVTSLASASSRSFDIQHALLGSRSLETLPPACHNPYTAVGETAAYALTTRSVLTDFAAK